MDPDDFSFGQDEFNPYVGLSAFSGDEFNPYVGLSAFSGDEFNPYVGLPSTIGGTGSSYETGAGLPGEEAAAGSQGGAGGTGNVLPAKTLTQRIQDAAKQFGLADDKGMMNPIALLGLTGLLASLSQGKSTPPIAGYQGAIPKYTAVRERLPLPAATDRRPGSAGRRYFSDVAFAPKTAPAPTVQAAEGGLMSMAKGRYLDGPTDGMEDKIPATIADKQPARLSHGEFVIPADVVSHLGNGNSNAGAQRLYDMMEKVRKARTGTPKQGKQINPNKYLPK